MAWEITDVQLDKDEVEVHIKVDFKQGGAKKSESTFVYPLDGNENQEDFYNKVVEDIQRTEPVGVKTPAERASEAQAAAAQKLSNAQAFVAANNGHAQFKLNGLKDTDV